MTMIPTCEKCGTAHMPYEYCVIHIETSVIQKAPKAPEHGLEYWKERALAAEAELLRRKQNAVERQRQSRAKRKKRAT